MLAALVAREAEKEAATALVVGSKRVGWRGSIRGDTPARSGGDAGEVSSSNDGDDGAAAVFPAPVFTGCGSATAPAKVGEEEEVEAKVEAPGPGGTSGGGRSVPPSCRPAPLIEEVEAAVAVECGGGTTGGCRAAVIGRCCCGAPARRPTSDALASVTGGGERLALRLRSSDWCPAQPFSFAGAAEADKDMGEDVTESWAVAGSGTAVTGVVGTLVLSTLSGTAHVGKRGGGAVVGPCSRMRSAG